MRLGSDLRDYWMDPFHILHQPRHISGGYAHYFRILKKFKMADFWPFLAFFFNSVNIFKLISQRLFDGSFSYLV